MMKHDSMEATLGRRVPLRANADRVSAPPLHAWFVPFVEVWTQERLPWASTPALHSFAIQPQFDDYGRLVEDFARRGARPT